jgi:hypothetical protein
MSNRTSNTKQEYTYSLRSVAYSGLTAAGSDLCHSELWFQVHAPDDYIALKRLRLHLIIQFDVAVPSGYQELLQIGITDDPVSYTIAGLPAHAGRYIQMVDINQVADGNRKINLNIDLTSLLHKTTSNNDYVYITFPRDDPTISPVVTGKVLLCKGDALYTTTGIR